MEQASWAASRVALMLHAEHSTPPVVMQPWCQRPGASVWRSISAHSAGVDADDAADGTSAAIDQQTDRTRSPTSAIYLVVQRSASRSKRRSYGHRH